MNSVVKSGIAIGTFCLRRSTTSGFASTGRRLPNPTDDDVAQLLRRMLPKFRRKLCPEAEPDRLDELDALASTAVRPPTRTREPTNLGHKRLCANIDGFSSHAGVKVHGNDVRGREHLCR